uniref:Ankyrin repeat domain-containing protein n=1 Tax=Linum usitatissimum TaxID=4006 RepID=I6YHY3_LINUS|nr:ankyrin repeat domain-containing protein [Linum usitatissimum]
MDADKHDDGGGGSLCRDFSPLLEFSASDDLHSFKRFVEDEGLQDVNEPGLWYGRRIGSNKMGLEVRTPLMIAALYGSKSVLSYILETLPSEDDVINKPCGSDGATALHCAAAAGNSDVVKLLLRASADPNSLNAAGNRPADLIIGRRNSLERLLGVEIGSSLPDEIDVLSTATPKKEYPIDLTLPDIKNGIYGTDEFRMYSFKDMKLKLRSTYPAAFPSSPAMDQTGFNNNSGRAAAFAKRSQSFVGRSSVNHHPIGFPTSPGKLSDWGSPDGKLEWKIQGEELSRFRKSASFAYRSSSNGNFGEPDLGSGMRSGQMGVGGPNQQQGHPDIGIPEMQPAWMEQFYSETEQMVAS